MIDCWGVRWLLCSCCCCEACTGVLTNRLTAALTFVCQYAATDQHIHTIFTTGWK